MQLKLKIPSQCLYVHGKWSSKQITMKFVWMSDHSVHVFRWIIFNNQKLFDCGINKNTTFLTEHILCMHVLCVCKHSGFYNTNYKRCFLLIRHAFIPSWKIFHVIWLNNLTLKKKKQAIPVFFTFGSLKECALT